jgi:hypothetical protein
VANILDLHQILRSPTSATPIVEAAEDTPEVEELTPPGKADNPHGVVAEQGRHEFRVWFPTGLNVTEDRLESIAIAARCPPLIADVTSGMGPVAAATELNRSDAVI